jgi:hypothetical protein
LRLFWVQKFLYIKSYSVEDEWVLIPRSQKTKKAQQAISQQDLLASLKTLPPSIVGEVVERQDKKILEQLVNDEPALNENDENKRFYKKHIDFVKLNLGTFLIRS